MRTSIVASCAVFSLALALGGCAGRQYVPVGARARGVANMQPAPPTVQDEGWATLVEADRQMERLRQDRDGTTDPFRLQVIDRNLALLGSRTQQLMNDMTRDDGRVHDVEIRADIANLNTITHGAATEMQRESTIP